MKIAYVMLYLLNPGAPPELVTQFALTPDRAVEQCAKTIKDLRGSGVTLVCVPVYKPE